jgi:hypothetical protein
VFQVWEFRVSHSQLLIRSPRSSEAPKNIDVVFVGVAFMEVPDIFRGLSVREGDSSQKGHIVYVLTSQGQQYRIVAAGATVIENELDLFESSLESFSS